MEGHPLNNYHIARVYLAQTRQLDSQLLHAAMHIKTTDIAYCDINMRHEIHVVDYDVSDTTSFLMP